MSELRKRIAVYLAIFMAGAGFTFLFFNTPNNEMEVRIDTKTVGENLENCKPGGPNSAKRGVYCTSMKAPFRGGNANFFGRLCAGIEKIVGKSTIADFGGGHGQYGMCFTRNLAPFETNPDVDYSKFLPTIRSQMKYANLTDKPQVIISYQAYDGATNIEKITHGWVKGLDLSVPFSLGVKYDWIMSTEVGEHIPNELEDNYLDNVVNHARKGVIISWAVEGQKGFNHINGHPNEYVVAKMEQRNMKHNVELQKILRSYSERYFLNTTMVFTFE